MAMDLAMVFGRTGFIISERSLTIVEIGAQPGRLGHIHLGRHAVNQAEFGELVQRFVNLRDE